MNIPEEITWGVNVAIKKLRPTAEFTLYGNRISEWYDESGSAAPTWEEIEAQMELDKKAYDDWIESNKE